MKSIKVKNIKFSSKKLNKYDDEYLGRLSNISFKSGGQMMYEIEDAINYPKSKSNRAAIVCTIPAIPGESFPKIIGWSYIKFESSTPEVQIFVDPRYRNKGVGSAIMTRVRKYIKRIGKSECFVFPHDKKSREFFKSIKLKDFNVRKV